MVGCLNIFNHIHICLANWEAFTRCFRQLSLIIPIVHMDHELDNANLIAYTTLIITLDGAVPRIENKIKGFSEGVKSVRQGSTDCFRNK